MNPAARAIALQALHNYLAGDLELTPDDVGEVLTMALARALALALAEGRMAEVDLDRLLDTVRLVLRRRRDLERRSPPLAARACQRLHPDHASVATALFDQCDDRDVEDPLANQAIAADAVTVGVELAEGVEDDLVGGGAHGPNCL
jgi:hypothetical protein